MFAVDNPTGFPAALVPGQAPDGRAEATVVVKATFRLRDGALQPADEQVPLLLVDDPADGRGSVRHESDLSPQKPGTDVLLVGHAWSPSPVPELDVRLEVGPLRKTVRVSGDRAFFRAGGEVGISPPRPFARMPLVWERSFGGAAEGGEGPPAFEERNPVGVGFCVDPERADGLRLPNLEDPRRLLTRPGDRPPPAGFGVVARHWMPRRAHFGAADAAWRADRFPLPPADFDRRFFQAAPADQIAARPLQGGEAVRIEGASEGGPLAFRLPRLALAVTVSIRRATARHAPVLDTVILEPDERRVTLVHRLTFPCPRDYLPLDGVRIALEGAS